MTVQRWGRRLGPAPSHLGPASPRSAKEPVGSAAPRRGAGTGFLLVGFPEAIGFGISPEVVRPRAACGCVVRGGGAWRVVGSRGGAARAHFTSDRVPLALSLFPPFAEAEHAPHGTPQPPPHSHIAGRRVVAAPGTARKGLGNPTAPGPGARLTLPFPEPAAQARMFVLVEMVDTVRIPPWQFERKLNDSIAEELNKKLANKVLGRRGRG